MSMDMRIASLTADGRFSLVPVDRWERIYWLNYCRTAMFEK
jgi:hypothetical protein